MDTDLFKDGVSIPVSGLKSKARLKNFGTLAAVLVAGALLVSVFIIPLLSLPVSASSSSSGVEIHSEKQPSTKCLVSPAQVAPGEDVLIDASGFEDVDRVKFDVDGDGNFEEVDKSDFKTKASYSEEGEYNPSVEVVHNESGETETDACGEVKVYANDPPEADFTFSPSPPKAGESTTFESTSSDPDGEISSYQWVIDGSDVSTESSFSWIFREPGSYEVTLKVKDDGGATDSVTKTVEVESNPPVANCFVSKKKASPGEMVTIDASGTENADYVRFDVDGDGSYDRRLDSGFITTSSYEVGSYEPKVKAVKGKMSDETTCGTILVEENVDPIANLSYSPTYPHPGDKVVFDASNSSDPDGEIKYYSFDVDGDGIYEYERNGNPVLEHKYESPGNKTVTVKVIDDHESTNTTTVVLEVEPNKPPNATFSYSPSTPTVGKSVTMTSVSGDPDGTVKRYEWLIDGKPVSRNDTLTWVFDETGKHEVVLRLRDDDGLTSSNTRVINVKTDNEPPKARFTHSPKSLKTKQKVVFESSSTDPDGSVSEYEWILEDKLVSEEKRFEWFFNDPGKYKVKLRIKDDRGANATETKIVTVTEPNDPPKAKMSYSSKRPLTGDSVTFRSRSIDPDGNISETEWIVDGLMLGDGDTFSHTFKDVGKHNVTLVVTDERGTTRTVSKNVNVTEPNKKPDVGFSLGSDKVVKGKEVEFSSDAKDPDGKITSYKWIVDGETVSTSDSLKHTFEKPGEHEVTLVVTDGDGATEKTTKKIKVENTSSENQDENNGSSGSNTMILVAGALGALILVGGGAVVWTQMSGQEPVDGEEVEGDGDVSDDESESGEDVEGDGDVSDDESESGEVEEDEEVAEEGPSTTEDGEIEDTGQEDKVNDTQGETETRDEGTETEETDNSEAEDGSDENGASQDESVETGDEAPDGTEEGENTPTDRDAEDSEEAEDGSEGPEDTSSGGGSEDGSEDSVDEDSQDTSSVEGSEDGSEDSVDEDSEDSSDEGS